MSKITDRVYRVSPLWLQQLGINVFGWSWARRRFGGAFATIARSYEERERWPASQMHEYISRTLREQVQRAYREIPYYRAAFREHGVTDDVIEKFTIDDLPKLPLLEKSTLRANPAALLTQAAAQRPPKRFMTSGTTGARVAVYWDSETHQHHMAVREARSLRWTGVSYRDSRAVTGGRLIVPKAYAYPPFWRYNRWEKQLYMSAFHVSPAHAPDYAAALNRFRPVWMTGYASANYFLACALSERGLEVPSPRAVITNSDHLYDYMRPKIESVFRSRVYQEYGSVENCALATECELGRLHVHPDFGCLEILTLEGRPAAPEEVGELVVTGFANTNQIFIRYRIGDLAAWAKEHCPCGRDTLPVLKEIIGRQEDAVIMRDGRRLMRLDHVFRDLPGVIEGQIVQEELDRFAINVVVDGAYSDRDAELMKQRLLTRIGPHITIEIRERDSIPREANGKFRQVISRVRASEAALHAPV